MLTLLFLYLATAIGISFLCSVLEAVLLSITPSYVAAISAKNQRGGDLLTRVRSKLDESLSAILILNTFAHTMGAAGVGSQALQLFGAQWETLVAVLLTLTILYFSEIIPKTLGATFWKALAVPAAFIILWLVKLVYPLVWIATRLTALIHRKPDSSVTREEIIAMASIGHKAGTLVNEENMYLSNLLSLREIPTEEVFTPRSVVHMLDETLTVTEALEDPKTPQFSRIPIYGEGVDDITGKVLRHDLYEAERSGRGDAPISEIANPISRVSEKLPVQQLLDLFIRRRVHLFLVEGEFGQTTGIVTLEDAIETLLGREIIDESDQVVDMQELARGQYRERLRTKRQKPNSN